MAIKGSTECWINDLNSFIQNDSKGALQLPIDDSTLFNDYLLRFTQTYQGLEHMRSSRLIFSNEKRLTFMSIRVLANSYN